MRHDSPFLSIRFSPNGREIATGDIAGNVDFWDAATGHRVGRTLGGQNGLVLSVTYSPDGKDVVTTSTDGKFRLWDIASGKLVGAPLPGAETGGWARSSPTGGRSSPSSTPAPASSGMSTPPRGRKRPAESRTET